MKWTPAISMEWNSETEHKPMPQCLSWNLQTLHLQTSLNQSWSKTSTLEMLCTKVEWRKKPTPRQFSIPAVGLSFAFFMAWVVTNQEKDLDCSVPRSRIKFKGPGHRRFCDVVYWPDHFWGTWPLQYLYTMWGPLVVSWFINPINHRYILP